MVMVMVVMVPISRHDDHAGSIPIIVTAIIPMVMVVMMMVVVVVVTVPARLDADMNASAMMVVVMMVMSDYDLGGLRAATLCQTLIIGLQ
jgi:hypothetical protein